MIDAITYVVLLVILAVILSSAIRILREYQRGVVFTLGRFSGVKGPGLFILIPFVQQMVKVALRIVVHNVPAQDVISRDNVSVKVNAVLYYRDVDPEDAILRVEDFMEATSSSLRRHCARCSASTTSTRCWPSATSSMPISRRFSISRPTRGASRLPI